jgi:lipopolysaccharide export system protein LptC
VPIAVTAEEITYDLKLQKVSSDKPVNVKWGSSTTDAQSLHLNILTGDFNTGAIKVNSANGILAPK